MNKFKPIAMRCNQQQYDDIKQILLNNGCKCRLDGTFINYPYLVNNYNDVNNHINHVYDHTKNTFRRTVFEIWNKNTFLEYCGIEIFNNQNNKTEFIVGKWYKYGNQYTKFSKIEDNLFLGTEHIYDGKYQKSILIESWIFPVNNNITLLTDLSEIQQYLPDGHPDKINIIPEYVEYINDWDRSWIKNKIYKTDNGLIKYESGQCCSEPIELLIKQNYFKPSTKEAFDAQNNNIKQPDLNNLLEEAKKRYPIGTKVDSLGGMSDQIINHNNPYFVENNKHIRFTENCLVYNEGQWAEIIEPAKPVETKSKYRIAAEEALKKFSDIQIGDEYMTIRNNTYIANKSPRIVEDGSDTFIDCGNGFLWRFDEPNLFGYKINKTIFKKTNAYPLPPNPIIANKQLIEKIQPIQLIKKKKIVMDTKINPIKSINTNLKIKNQKLWN